MKTLYNEEKTSRIVIDYDECCESPREWDSIGKMCIRKHINYTFPNELDFDFDDDDTDVDGDWKTLYTLMELKKSYHIVFIDMYEHSGICFSIAGTGTQCRFDTSNGIGFFAIPKAYNSYDIQEWNKSKKQDQGEKVEVNELQAMEIAKGELETYNQYLNGEVYCFVIQEKETRTDSKGETKEERETIESFGGLYSIDDILADYPGYKEI